MKLSAKKNGKGYITSYTVNISCVEARTAGLIDKDGNSREVAKIFFADKNKTEIVFKS